MQLDPGARAVIAEALIDSFDIDDQTAISPEWREEIRRRREAIESGEGVLLDHADVIAELRAKYAR